MTADVDTLYQQHLTETDRRLLRSVTGIESPSLALGHPAVEAAVFRPADDDDRSLVGTSPFLTFATAVHRTAARLETASFVEERWTPRQRVAVFDVRSLRDLLAEPVRRLFLVELLASYTHVHSGVTWERTPRGWRRRRFSELDPVRLAGLLEVVDARERPGVLRRLGDLALFLTGVFPDHPSAATIGGAAAGRLLRLTGVPGRQGEDRAGQALLEQLGARWYGLAAASAKAQGTPMTSALAVMEEMAARFHDARRVLNVVTDRYLFPVRDRWFGVA
ncbi:MAG TPA: hypothetical protein VE575_13670 [Acidimicrobiales bacterium]|jgi:hypothetical protein|nr:hypothetical protein [Acidimicrobiales bacterium]